MPQVFVSVIMHWGHESGCTQFRNHLIFILFYKNYLCTQPKLSWSRACWALCGISVFSLHCKFSVVYRYLWGKYSGPKIVYSGLTFRYQEIIIWLQHRYFKEKSSNLLFAESLFCSTNFILTNNITIWNIRGILLMLIISRDYNVSNLFSQTTVKHCHQEHDEVQIIFIEIRAL